MRTIRDALAPHGGRVRVFFMDEGRFGQQGTMTRLWARTGSRPTVVKQTKYEWVYLYAAVEPATGADVALQAPEVNTETFNVFLRMLAEELGPKDHAILILDRAGWHTSRRVTPPDSITMLLLPAYSPELNPVENLWQYLRSHHLSNRAYRDYRDILDAGAAAYRALTPERLRSVCRCPYLERETQA